MLDPRTNPPDWWQLRGGLYRSPYVQPLQHDFRVLTRLPVVFQVPSSVHSVDRSEGFVRHWGVMPVDVVGPVPVTYQGAGVSKVEGDPERVRWCDSTRCHRAAALAVRPRVWEVARCVVPRYAVATLERVATFLNAQPLDDDGGDVGPPFITNQMTPLCAVPIHPDLPAADAALTVRWHLRQHGGRLPTPLVASPAQHLPHADGADGIDPTWADWRYTWQGRYTQDHKAVLRARVVRLFAELSTPEPNRWRVNVGGLLTSWYQAANPYGNAIARRAATTR